MEEITRARYKGYTLLACTALNVTKDPLKILEEYKPAKGELQLFNAEIIVSERHVVAAFMAAVSSVLSGTARARKLGVEFLLKLSASTQISEALEKVGIKSSYKDVGVALLAKSELDEASFEEVVKALGGRLASVSAVGDPKKAAELYGLSYEGGVVELELLVLERIATAGLLE